MTTPPPLDLAALRKTAEAATPGPWIIDELETGEHGLFVDEDNPDYQALGCGLSQVAGFMEGKNAAHIAAFDPPTVLALLDRVEAAERKASELERGFDAERADKYMAEDAAKTWRLHAVTAEATVDRVRALLARWERLQQMLAIAPGASMTPLEDVISDLRGTIQALDGGAS